MNCYDFPQYWDLAFRSETKLEADFIEGACAKYCRQKARQLFEPGCGGGRLVVELAARGYDLTALDLSAPAIHYVRKRLHRRGLRGDALVGDMADFKLRRPVDAAFGTFNTFRHLTTEAAARHHLQAVAANLRAGGIYILGFHLLPPDADEECVERWSARHGRTHVSMMLRVLKCDRRRRLETIRFALRVRSGRRDLRLSTDYQYRLYTAAQFRRLLASVPAFELCDVFDFWYDLQEPLQLDDELGDAVFILRRR